MNITGTLAETLCPSPIKEALTVRSLQSDIRSILTSGALTPNQTPHTSKTHNILSDITQSEAAPLSFTRARTCPSPTADHSPWMANRRHPSFQNLLSDMAAICQSPSPLMSNGGETGTCVHVRVHPHLCQMEDRQRRVSIPAHVQRDGVLHVRSFLSETLCCVH